MSAPTVWFVAHELRRRWPELDRPDSVVDVASVPVARLHLIENTWVVSTYLRLRAHGADVRITDRAVPGHVNVCTSERILGHPGAHEAFVVVADADRRDLLWGDFHVVQSPALLRGPRTALVDHWPQPGIAARDAARGDRIERVAYYGYPDNLAAPFRRPAFREALAARGVDLAFRDRPEEWHDYRDVDLCLAVRSLTRYWIETKPSTKLVQAWLAGCPGLLGPEPSYRHWGRDGEDYFEVASPEDAVAVVDRLRADPAVYRRAIDLGRAKGRDHDEAAVVRQWTGLLGGPVREAFERWTADGVPTSRARRIAFGFTRVAEPVQRGLFRLRAEGARTALRLAGVR